jgi:hypothetical protein
MSLRMAVPSSHAAARGGGRDLRVWRGEQTTNTPMVSICSRLTCVLVQFLAVKKRAAPEGPLFPFVPFGSD